MTDDDLAYLRAAIRLSVDKMSSGEGGPFGAVVVKDGRIVGEGWNRVTSINDPTAHAEIVAVRAACATLGSFSLAGCTLYSSCEPCPMCLAAIYWARLDRLVFAATREDAAAAAFDDAFLYEEFARPMQQRTLKPEQALRDEALEAFRLWSAKADRLPY